MVLVDEWPETASLKHVSEVISDAPRWQSPAERIRLQSGTPAGSNPALGFLRRTTREERKPYGFEP